MLNESDTTPIDAPAEPRPLEQLSPAELRKRIGPGAGRR